MLFGMARIAIIGGGSIGEALLSGLLRAGRQVKDLVVAERMPDRANYLAQTYSVLVTSAADAVENATFVVVAVKPADVEPVIADLANATAAAENDSAEQVFVTVVAGITIAYFESSYRLGRQWCVRCRTRRHWWERGYSAGQRPLCHPQQLEEVSALFDAVGGVLTVPESQLDAVTAVSGSGPAYFFLLVEALVDAGVGVGLSRQVATDLAAQTMAGSAAMLLERMEQDQGGANGELMGLRVDLTASRLRAAVTSPGGTTAAALRELERGGFRMAVDAAVQAAKAALSSSELHRNDSRILN